MTPVETANANSLSYKRSTIGFTVQGGARQSGELVEYPTTVPWNGKVLGGYVRNSTWIQRDNARSEFQRVDMGQYAKDRGYAVRWFDERNQSGTRMHNRIKLQTLLGLIARGEIHGIVCADVSRLSRDERLLDPLLIGETLREHAEGRLLTHGGELDLRRPNDWKLFTFLARVASQLCGDTLIAASQGYKVAVQRVFQGERAVFRKGKVMVGYRRVAVLGTCGSPLYKSNGRLVTTYEKNPSDEPLLTALAEEFDRQPTLTDVVRALRRRGITGPCHASGGGTWTVRLFRQILNDRLYVGVWTAADTPVAVRRMLEADGLHIGDAEFPVPHLAWWSGPQMQRWCSKLLNADAPPRYRRNFRYRKIPHPLLGLAFCAACRVPLGSLGSIDDGYQDRVAYRCLNRDKGCPKRLLRTEERMLKAMASHLSDTLQQTAAVTSALRAGVGIANGDIEARLRALTGREHFIRDKWLRCMKVPRIGY